MLPKNNRYNEAQKKIAEMTRLSPEEEIELANIIKIISSGTPKERFEMIKNFIINGKTMDKVFKFYHSDKDEQHVFREFCLANPHNFYKQWRQVLDYLKLTGYDTLSLDLSKKTNVCEFYLGAFCFAQYKNYVTGKNTLKEHEARSYLDQACSYGIFQALVERCLINKKIIKNSSSDADRTDAHTQFNVDTIQMGNLHWTKGYLHAALLQLDLANYFAKQQSSEAARARAHYEMALENVLYAKAVNTFKPLPAGEKVSMMLIDKKGNKTEYAFTDFDTTETYFRSHLDSTFNASQINKQIEEEMLRYQQSQAEAKPVTNI